MSLYLFLLKLFCKSRKRFQYLTLANSTWLEEALWRCFFLRGQEFVWIVVSVPPPTSVSVTSTYCPEITICTSAEYEHRTDNSLLRRCRYWNSTNGPEEWSNDSWILSFPRFWGKLQWVETVQTGFENISDNVTYQSEIRDLYYFKALLTWFNSVHWILISRNTYLITFSLMLSETLKVKLPGINSPLNKLWNWLSDSQMKIK